jgi:hypothetical protein
MVRTTPFTSFEEFGGIAPYMAMPAPNPNAPSVRPAQVPPITAPTRGMFGWRKAALPGAVTAFQSTALSPQGPVTYGSASVAGPAVYASNR